MNLDVQKYFTISNMHNIFDINLHLRTWKNTDLGQNSEQIAVFIRKKSEIYAEVLNLEKNSYNALKVPKILALMTV